MVTEGPGWGVKCRCLALLVFLLVYLPLDACDADAFDTFEDGAVRIGAQADEGAVYTVHLPVVTVPETASTAVRCDAAALLSEPVCTFVVTRKPFNLPRSDDPHVASLPPVKASTHPCLV